MSLAGLGQLGGPGFRDLGAEARFLAIWSLVSFVYVRKGSGVGTKGDRLALQLEGWQIPEGTPTCLPSG